MRSQVLRARRHEEVELEGCKYLQGRIEACARHCRSCARNGALQSSLAPCALACLNCADFCAALLKQLARGGEHSSDLCSSCARLCEMCAQECGRHPVEHSGRCAEACRACAKACHEQVSEASVPERFTERPGQGVQVLARSADAPA